MFQLLQTKAVDNSSIMVQQGKIYLVMTIVTIILVGLFIYVASVDKKISALENNAKD
ncbi:MAG: CcmD family protein [Bacteroidetes bacterium]|nr:CcmD family protein [Bacteroidota bacterium]